MTGFPFVRMRRFRQADWSRRLVRESILTPADFIYPLFLTEGKDIVEPIDSLPGQARLSIDQAAIKAKAAKDAGIPIIALFPNTPQSLRDDKGSEALNPDCLTARAVKLIKDKVPDIGLMVDVALDPYTSHGHDGLLRDGEIINDDTVEVLCKQALLLAKAGADILSPSDMMDGRIRAIRKCLEEEGYHNKLIFSYAAKYASAFYGPFRDAVGASKTLTGDKKTYQMDSGNALEALRECHLDEQEGADALIIKPGLPYLDVLHQVSAVSSLPTIAYQVSGEYAMIAAAAERGWINADQVRYESLIAFKRAGARAIISYFALDVAQSFT